MVTTEVSSSRSLRSKGTDNAPAAGSRHSWASAETVAPGPTSTNADTPAAASASTPSANWTGSRTLRTQYSGVAISADAGSPVTVETNGTTGSRNVRPCATRRNSSSIGSISAECAARETRTRVAFSNRSASASTAASSPETTTVPGPFTAAMHTSSPSSGRTSSTPARNDIIAPPSGSASISRPRASTRTHASRSDSTPAAWAAATSPTEWPSTWSGRSPHDSSSRSSATWTANSAGCAKSIRARRSWSSPQTTSRSAGSNSARTASNASANTAKRWYSSRPMPTCWVPCPENMNATTGSLTALATEAPAAGSTAASAVSPALARDRSAATTAARYSKPERVVASEKARSPRSTLSTVDVSCAARARRAAGVRPDTRSGAAARGRRSGSSAGSGAGACSTMTCALVPLMPNDETPARRTSASAGQSAWSVSSSTAPASQSTCEDGASTCRVFSSRPCRIDWTILITPATPAAAWVWPRLDLTEPSSSGVSRSWP